MTTKVAIIGGGWYGCHIAHQLLQNHKDTLSLTLFEKENKLFSKSSSHNQNRLHLGFHYMRSFKTRQECLRGYEQFLERYHSVCKPVAHNLYVVHKNSLIDQQTIFHILEHENIPFRITPKSKFYKLFNLDLIDGDLFDVDEMFIDPEKSRKFFMRHLSSVLQLNVECQPLQRGFFRGSSKIASFDDFDHLIFCVFEQIIHPQWIQSFGLIFQTPLYFKERCLTLLYKLTVPIFENAITVIDGPFFSLYPYRNDLYTLTHVLYTPLNDESDLHILRKKMEDEVIELFPKFYECFTYDSYYISWKMKLEANGTDDRSVRIQHQDKFSFICGGKITGIFSAYTEIENELFPRFQKKTSQEESISSNSSDSSDHDQEC